jgi:riboflavin biosynthesis pyrimidine reductase
MLSSVDGSVQTRRWRPKLDGAAIFERLHDGMEGDAWLVGRTTGEEFARRDGEYPEYSGPPIPREDWFAIDKSDAWGVVLDAHGKIAWGMSDIGGDPIVVALTRRVPDRHLAGLRADRVSYIFAGDGELDLAAVLETLNARLGVERLLMEGGGSANGAMLRAGLIDELHLVVCPTVDGARSSPRVFDVDGAEAEPFSIGDMTLEETKVLDGGCVLLRYRISAF